MMVSQLRRRTGWAVASLVHLSGQGCNGVSLTELAEPLLTFRELAPEDILEVLIRPLQLGDTGTDRGTQLIGKPKGRTLICHGADTAHEAQGTIDRARLRLDGVARKNPWSRLPRP